MTSSNPKQSNTTQPTGLTVAVTGPTGEIGISTVDALERDPAVARIVGMARRPFDPDSHGWTKTSYLQGDILDRDAVDALVRDADVVVHLAFIVLGTREESQLARCRHVDRRHREQKVWQGGRFTHNRGRDLR